MQISRVGFITAVVIAFGAASAPAHAYIDPGTGSSLFSSLGVILGAVVTMLALCISQIRRCGEWFIARFRAGSTEPASSDTESAGKACVRTTDK